MPKRCEWVSNEPIYIDYHDNEWGRPVYDDLQLFEFLNLEGMQAGLSWITILKKRENYRKAFDNFNPEKIAKYSDKKIQQLLENPGIIRNKLKVNAIVKNAQAFLDLKDQGVDFSDYLWSFVNNQPVVNHWANLSHVPTSTEEARAMAKALKKHGFKFVGETICYAFMQAVGMVNDHTKECFLYKK